MNRDLEIAKAELAVWRDVIGQLDEIAFGQRRTGTGNTADLIRRVRKLHDDAWSDGYQEGHSDGHTSASEGTT